MMTSCYVPAFAPFLGKYSADFGISKITYEFKNDGTFTYTNNIYATPYTPAMTENKSGKYTFDATKITIDGTAATYKMSDNNKTLTLDGVKFTKE